MSYSTLRVRPAGFFSRSFALVIDLILIWTSATLFGFLASGVLSFFNIDTLFQSLLGAYIDIPTLLRISISVIYSFYVLAYFAFFWSLTGFSPGKFILGLRVVTTDGKKLRFWRALARALCYYLSGILLFAGFFLIIFDKNRQALHDKITRTLVVYT